MPTEKNQLRECHKHLKFNLSKTQLIICRKTSYSSSCLRLRRSSPQSRTATSAPTTSQWATVPLVAGVLHSRPLILGLSVRSVLTPLVTHHCFRNYHKSLPLPAFFVLPFRPGLYTISRGNSLKHKCSHVIFWKKIIPTGFPTTRKAKPGSVSLAPRALRKRYSTFPPTFSSLCSSPSQIQGGGWFLFCGRRCFQSTHQGLGLSQ